ncbi:hypothetical protein MXD61_11485 [Frankia sp. AgPm24]|uniref:hypothetical protein n=1 Tax=Frankia sp. AgPm24 TaxID=631128 RepID=UPI00200D4F55|nr:hypothetical protein [Frankia sp. AgPm24]MCK9922493.1 hypothetical protein [Frankia sp. AgPm24]
MRTVPTPQPVRSVPGALRPFHAGECANHYRPGPLPEIQPLRDIYRSPGTEDAALRLLRAR